MPMAQSLRWDTQMEFQTPRFDLVQPQLLMLFVQWMETLCVSLCLKLCLPNQ